MMVGPIEATRMTIPFHHWDPHASCRSPQLQPRSSPLRQTATTMLEQHPDLQGGSLQSLSSHSASSPRNNKSSHA